MPGMQHITKLFFLLWLSVAQPVFAAVITIGSLESKDDGSTQVITDTLNNREWLRWDVIAGLTYSELVAATSVGGIYEDFQIAQIHDFGLFMDAMNSSVGNTCQPQSTSVSCGNLAGSSVSEYLQLLGNANSDNNWTYSVVIDPINQDKVALLYMADGSGSFGINRNWKTVLDMDNTHSHSGGRDIGYLVYRNIDPNLVAVEFTGYIDYMNNSYTSVPGTGIDVGDTFSGTFTYRKNAIQDESATTVHTLGIWYEFDGSYITVDLSITGENGYTAISYEGPATIALYDDHCCDDDNTYLVANGPLALTTSSNIADWTPRFSTDRVVRTGGDPDIFPYDNAPPVIPTSIDWDGVRRATTSMTFRFTDPSNGTGYHVYTRFTSFSTVTAGQSPIDTDGDGVIDSEDAFPNDPAEWLDSDGDGTGNNADTDDDNDGVIDAADACPFDALGSITDTDSDGLCDEGGDTDDDNDAWSDSNETACGTNPLSNASIPADTDGDSTCNALDTDDDNDSWSDSNETACGTNPLSNASVPVDTDGDSTCNVLDTDDDNDAWSDSDEIACGTNPLSNASIPVDTDGDSTCNVLDSDDDNDGVLDGADLFPLDATEWADADNDGVGNNADSDDDNDGVLDTVDNCDFMENPNQLDANADGEGDVCDQDDDTDADGVLDFLDHYPANEAASLDTDGDGHPDEWSASCNNNCQNNSGLQLDNCPSLINVTQLDTDRDDQGNACDLDDDNDGVDDEFDDFPLNEAASIDSDGDGLPDDWNAGCKTSCQNSSGLFLDTDDDNDGALDIDDAFPLNPTEYLDTDGDGIGNNQDWDDDGDGVIDGVDSDPLDNGVISEVKFLLNGAYKGNNLLNLSHLAESIPQSPAIISDVSRNFIIGNYIVDLDSDGDLDVLSSGNPAQWAENQSGSFVSNALPIVASQIFAADMDNDNDIDIVASSGAVISLYKNNGNEVFTSSVIYNRSYSLVFESHGIYLADIDSDGDMDVIDAWLGENWYENDGNGNFTRHVITGRGKDIIAADLDSDGDMDIIGSDNELNWWVNDGNENFSLTVIYDDGFSSSFPIDIDKDGDVDLVAVRRWQTELELFVNDGSGNFSVVLVSSEKHSPKLFASDIDNDGSIDILNGNHWYKNTGNNNFSYQGSMTLDFSTLIDLAE